MYAVKVSLKYISQNPFLYIVFEEQSVKEKLLDNKFLGFKQLSFTDEFITEELKRVWDKIRYLVNKVKLEETVVTHKDGAPIINRNGMLRKIINFPKSKDYCVFVRGTGSASSNKPLHLNGVDMYYQQVWIRGLAMVEQLEELDFL